MKSRQKELVIYLADDHDIVAKALGNLIASLDGVGSVRTFANGKELYKACLSAYPDLIILDHEMPEWDGITTLRKIRDSSSVPVVMLSMSDEKTMIEESIKAGASGYLNKNCTPQELQLAINSVISGSIFLSEEVKKIMIGLKTRTEETPVLAEALTDKEYEVLKLVCEGLSSKEIGEKLFISSRTVETRKNNLMQKFNVQSTGKLIAYAMKNKIVK